MTQQPGPPPGVDYDRRWLVMVSIGLGIFLGTIDGSIVNVALPTLVDEFGTSFGVAQWIVLGYLLTLSTLVLAVGRLGDMVGKKRIYPFGFGVFTAASMLAGLSPTVGFLIGFRVLQAVGAAMIFALGFAIITEAFPPKERGRALGIAGSIVSVGIIIGPTLGGLLIDSFSWRWIFYVNLPVGIFGTLAALRFIPDVPPPGGQRFDFAGAGVWFVALLTLLLGLTLSQERGADPVVVALLVVAAAALVVFVVVERRAAQPMLDLAMFRTRLLSVNLFSGWLTFVGIAGLLILLPFYLENVLGYEPREVGLLLAAAPVTLGLVAPLSGSIADRIGERPVTVVGLAVLLVGYLSLQTLDTDTAAWEYVAVLVPIGLGMGIFQSPNNSAIMGSVSRARLGIASGMLAFTRTLGQISGVALLGALWAARTLAHQGGVRSSDVTGAPVAAQVAGMHDAFIVLTIVMIFALGLTVWGLVHARRVRRSAPVPL